MRSTTVERFPVEDVSPSATPDFGRLVHIYRWMEWLSFGPFLWRCRCAFLDLLENHRVALVLGDGDGRFTARLLRENTNVAIDAVDASGAMLEELCRRAGSSSNRVRTFLGDARGFCPSRRDYDLVVTHFFLDCLATTEVESIALRVGSHASDDAVWVVSEFAVPCSWYGQWVARPAISFLYLVFGGLTGLRNRRLPNHRLALTHAGWSLEREREWLGGLLVSELWRRNAQGSTSRPPL
jgi:hypothetical protein